MFWLKKKRNESVWTYQSNTKPARRRDSRCPAPSFFQRPSDISTPFVLPLRLKCPGCQVKKYQESEENVLRRRESTTLFEPQRYISPPGIWDSFTKEICRAFVPQLSTFALSFTYHTSRGHVTLGHKISPTRVSETDIQLITDWYYFHDDCQQIFVLFYSFHQCSKNIKLCVKLSLSIFVHATICFRRAVARYDKATVFANSPSW